MEQILTELCKVFRPNICLQSCLWKGFRDGGKMFPEKPTSLLQCCLQQFVLIGFPHSVFFLE